MSFKGGQVVGRFPFPAFRFTAERAHVAQSVEHVLGKDEVTSSILVVGSNEGTGSGNGKR